MLILESFHKNISLTGVLVESSLPYSPQTLKHGLDSGVVFQFIIHSYLTMLIWSKIGQLTIAGQWPGANICHTLQTASGSATWLEA